MRIFYKPLSLKALFLPLLTLGVWLASASSVSGAIVQLGSVSASAGSGFPNPFSDQFNASRQQYLYLASELRAAGMKPGRITQIQFGIQNFASRSIGRYRVSGGMTTATSLSNTTWDPGGATTIFFEAGNPPGPAMGTPIPPAAPPTSNTWAILNPTSSAGILWDGVQNIVIEICIEQVDNARTSSPTTYYMTTTFPSTHSSASNTATAACGIPSLPAQGTQTLRPITKFDFVPNCIVPDSINIDSVKAYTAKLSWPPSPTGNPYVRAYNWFYWPKGTTRPTNFNGTKPNITSFDLDALIPETCYYVSLQADCKFTGAVTDTSVTIIDSFCTIADCAQPVATVDRVTSTTAVASWPPVPTSYDYEYAVSVMETAPTSGTRTTSTAVQLMGLTPRQVYYFYVRAWCSQTPQSKWTRVQFRPLAGLGFENVSNGFSLSVYPNPVKDVMTVQVLNPSGKASIEITDLTGKLVRTAAVTSDNLNVDMSGLNAGIYLLKYTDGSQSKVVKITKE